MIDKSQFQQAVYDIVRLIPSGRATSYGAIAKAIGFPNHARLVGKVMNSCSFNNRYVPAHRVVNSQGELVGRHRFKDEYEMSHLLEKEGIKIVDNRIRNWTQTFWDPMENVQI